MILTGTYERNLDAKGRLSLPAQLRDELGKSVHVVPAPDVDALYVFSDEAYEEWVKGLFKGQDGTGGFNPRSQRDQKLMRWLNANAASIDIDSASRIGLSEKLRAEKHLEREVAVIGNFDHLEIWDRSTWEAQSADAEDDLADLFFS